MHHSRRQLRGWKRLRRAGSLSAAVLLLATAPALAQEARSRGGSRSDNVDSSPARASSRAAEVSSNQQRTARSRSGSSSSSSARSGSSSSARSGSRSQATSTRSRTGSASRTRSSASSRSSGERTSVSGVSRYRGSRDSHYGRYPSRGHRGYYGGHYGGHYGGYYGDYYGGYYYRGYRYYPYTYWGWPWTWGSWVYVGAERPYGYYDYDRRELGALDLDISPEKAEVYLDGQKIGVADDFDGFPTYLWLEPGTYDLVFYYEGRRTLARQYVIRSGLVIDVEDDLPRGESIRPEDLIAKTDYNRQDRLRRDAERRAEADWEERRRAAEVEPYDARAEPGRLELRVQPEDASVYLDGRLLGSGAELARLHSGLIVDPGPHLIEVLRPGFETREIRFEVEAGESVNVEAILSED